jgi:hypothetical protein
MDLTISFLTESRAPAWGLPPLLVANFTGQFASLDDARQIAFADADEG